jgi:hypothetical protein
MSSHSLPTMMDLYVYYKVREQDAAALAPRVRAMQAALAREGAAVQPNFQLNFQLKRRPETRDGMQTWMEVYPVVDGAFLARLDDAAAQAGLAGLIAGPRRAEVFVDLPTELLIDPDRESTPCA